MSTPSLALAYIIANQNQKEVTANANFLALDQAGNAIATWATAGADVTLTQAQLASAFVHALTGALTADQHLILPAGVTRIFAVQNSTTGGHNIVVEVTGAPGTTVSIAATAGIVLLESDGTNVAPIAAASSGGGSIPGPTTLSLAPGASGNFQVAHGLGVIPRVVLPPQMTSSGEIYFQSTIADATYIYLVASDPSVTGKLLCWA